MLISFEAKAQRRVYIVRDQYPTEQNQKSTFREFERINPKKGLRWPPAFPLLVSAIQSLLLFTWACQQTSPTGCRRSLDWHGELQLAEHILHDLTPLVYEDLHLEIWMTSRYRRPDCSNTSQLTVVRRSEVRTSTTNCAPKTRLLKHLLTFPNIRNRAWGRAPITIPAARHNRVNTTSVETDSRRDTVWSYATVLINIKWDFCGRTVIGSIARELWQSIANR